MKITKIPAVQDLAWCLGSDGCYFICLCAIAEEITGKEIDLILEENMTLYPIEIKRTATPTANDMKNFDILESIKGNKQIGEGAIVCLHPQFVPMSRNVVAIPVSYI